MICLSSSIPHFAEKVNRKRNAFNVFYFYSQKRIRSANHLSKTTNRFIFSKIERLNPQPVTISTSTYANKDESYLNNAFIEKRNVVIPFTS